MVILRPNTTIAVLAPCSAYNAAKFKSGLDILKRFDFDFYQLPDAPAPHRYLAGSDAFRAEQLTEAFTNKRFGAIWAIRGGYGMTRILPLLDFSKFVAKPLIGFSDLVALQVPLAEMGFPVVHGPVIHSIPQTDDASIQHLMQLLAGEPTAPLVGETWVEGEVTAPIVGGNLCMLAATCGSPWQLNARGKIVVLEDIGEQAYRVDRLLQQLHTAGVFNGVAGLAFGEFTDCPAPANATYDVIDVLKEHGAALGVPVIGRLPIGHSNANHAFRWNQIACIKNGQLLLMP